MRPSARIACFLLLAGICLADSPQYRARIAPDGGGKLPSMPLFIPPVAGQELPPCRIVNAFADGLVIYQVPVVIDPGADPIARRFEDKCAITIWLKGYRKVNATLHADAVLTLHPIGDPEGSTVSVTAPKVPKDAAKAYDKGLEAFSDGKLPAARKQLERAVASYPDYAQAWSQLGEVLEQQDSPAEAVAAREHALKADPRYIRPYLQLMRLAFHAKKMQETVDLGDRALALDPVEFPGIYYYYAAASYDLKNTVAAEKSVRTAIDLDKAHDYPASEALLGELLAAKGDPHGALTHFREYLKLAPKADDAPAIRRRIADLEPAPASQ